ncbi:MAG TPA: hypothetical protein VFS63_00065 [Pseudolabrys sp.]|nr:hypothetical protein [Pseudolabrys sp.]
MTGTNAGINSSNGTVTNSGSITGRNTGIFASSTATVIGGGLEWREGRMALYARADYLALSTKARSSKDRRACAFNFNFDGSAPLRTHLRSLYEAIVAALSGTTRSGRKMGADYRRIKRRPRRALLHG